MPWTFHELMQLLEHIGLTGIVAILLIIRIEKAIDQLRAEVREQTVVIERCLSNRTSPPSA